MTINEVSAEIAKLNDQFRKVETFSVTQGVFGLRDMLGLVQAVRDYTDFTEDNDPYGEHDFGSLDWDGEKVFWKIDYYDQTSQKWHDPLDPGCERVLTVLLASEY